MTAKQFYDWQTAGGTDDVMRRVDCLERAGRLVEVATKLPAVLGEAPFEDHNLFRDRVDEALNRCARWRRSAPTSSPSRRKPRGCWMDC